MGRKDKYQTHIQPKLKKISEWKQVMTESQIAKRLGVSVSSFEKYKIREPELLEALKAGNEELIEELKSTLKKKAKGFTYEEKKVTQKIEDGKVISTTVEKYERYAPPDLGAIHLLLKNLDDTWRNDDKATQDLKKEQVEIAKMKAEENNW